MTNGNPKQYVGLTTPSKEGPRLATGQGRYTDDFTEPGMLQAVFIRSPHAHARIVGVDARGGAEPAGRVRGGDPRGHEAGHQAVSSGALCRRAEEAHRGIRRSRGQGPLRGRAGGRGGGQGPQHGGGCAGVHQRGLRDPAGHHRRPPGHGRRGAVPHLRRAGLQPGVAGNAGVRRYRNGLPRSRPGGAGEPQDPPLQLDAAGAAGVHRLLRPLQPQAHGPHQHPGAGEHLRRAAGRPPARRHPGHHPGHRRRLRPEDPPDPQVRRHRGAAGHQVRPSGEVDRGPQRAHDGRRPRLRAALRRRSRGEERRHRHRTALQGSRRRGRIR